MELYFLKSPSKHNVFLLVRSPLRAASSALHTALRVESSRAGTFAEVLEADSLELRECSEAHLSLP